MSNLDQITPLILTFNEAPNIARTLEKLAWARRVVVIDSFSTDDTMAVLARFPQVEVFQRKYTNAAEQDNFGLEKIPGGWVLSMDADYVLDESLIGAMKNLTLDEAQFAGYEVSFKYAIFGKPLRGTLYTPRKMLYFRQKAHYINDGHTQRVVIDGPVAPVGGFILHDDRKPLSSWFLNQDRYLRLEAEKLATIPFGQMKMVDKLRWMVVPGPFFAFFYCLIFKGCILDGWHGWYYSLQRMLAETMLSLRLAELRFLAPPRPPRRGGDATPHKEQAQHKPLNINELDESNLGNPDHPGSRVSPPPGGPGGAICIIGCGTYGAYLTKRLVEELGPAAQITVIEIGNERIRDESETGIGAESPVSRAAQLGRYFGLGGTSARWGGQVLFFDERDFFECRIQKAECRMAAAPDSQTTVWGEIIAVCQRFRSVVLGNLLGGNSGKFERLLDGGGTVRTGIWMKYSKRNTFKLLDKKALASVDILKDLRVVDFVFDKKRIAAVVCKSVDGAEKAIAADRFYLTAGAIESCRLLLEINEKRGGIFPAKDLGRNFGDHISVPLFKVKGHPPVVAGQSLLPTFLDGSLVTKRLVVRTRNSKPETQNLERVGFAHPIFNEDVRVFSSIKKMLFGKMKVDFSLRDVVTGIEFLARFGFSVLFLKKMYAHRNNWTLRLDIEQAFPNENRIVLSEKTDRFGQKAARLDWQVSAADRLSIEEVRRDLAEFLKKEGIPFTHIEAAADGGAKVEDVYHPAGFLRMGHDPDAPLDMDCRVRGAENLWHFSTAMFPSARSINPTAAGFCFIERHILAGGF